MYMADDSVEFKKTNRAYVSIATTVFSLLLLIVICRLNFPGKRVFIVMYILTIMSYTAIIYNAHMPAFMQFTPRTHRPLSPPVACDDSAVRELIPDPYPTPLERRLLLHDF